VAVEPTSLALLTCAKTGDRSGAAWQAVLEPFVNLELVVSDAAKGIAAGVQAVAASRSAAPAAPAAAAAPAHGLDVFHTNQEARRVLAGPWRRAEAAWEQAAAADAPVAAAKQRGQDARGVAAAARQAWARATRQLAAVDRLESAWQRARAALAVFRPDGTVNDRAWAEAEMQAALAELRGPAWQKVRNFLTDARALTFLDRLHRRLAEAVPGAALRRACVRRWWLRHLPPRPAALAPPGRAQVQALLDAKIRDGELTAAEQAAYERVAQVPRTTVRASSAVEGINSVLRMQQGRHRKLTQGLLDLKRLYWNCRRLPTGRRRGHCPYELLEVPLPRTDFWTLLQRGPPAAAAGERTEELSGPADAACDSAPVATLCKSRNI
jgi:hypothetical protein